MRHKLLSPRDLATALGTSESSVKRWVDEGVIPASKTKGGHRRIALPDAVAYARARGMAVVRPDLLGLSADLAPSGLGALSADFASILEGGRGRDLVALLERRYLAGESVADLCDGPLRAALERIGQLWREREDGVFIEHRATVICVAALHRLQEILPYHAGALALGGACAGDASVLPSLMVSMVLREAGMRPVNLGADTPQAALLAAADTHRPRLVWLSVNHVEDRDAASLEVRRLCDALEDRGVPLVLGGRAARDLDLPRSPRLFAIERLAELRAFAAGIGV